MPNRIVREAILSSEKMALLGWPEEVFFRRLMSIVDDYGRYEANPQLLRARCYPLQTDAVRVTDITRWMAACQTAGVILCYAVLGKQYVQVINFGQQQRTDSKYPEPISVDIKCSQEIADAHLVVSVSVSEDVVEDDKKRSRATTPDGVSEIVWKDFLQIRKAKKAPMNDTALMGIQREAGKAGLTLQRAIEISCERGWQSFKADWVADDKAVQATVTVPSRNGRDPALQKLDDDARNTKGPSLETLARMAALRQGAPA